MINTAQRKNTVEQSLKTENRRLWLYIALALGLTITIAGLLDILEQGIPLGFVIPIVKLPATVATLLYYINVLIIGTLVGIFGLKELVIEKRFSVEFLMAVAAFGAAYLGLLFEAATVLFLYGLAEYFEGYIEDRARKTVESLSKFMPDSATVLLEGAEKKIDVKDVRLGSIIVLRSGERVPLDSLVVEGTSSIDQSLVTGESAPIVKKKDDIAYAGTLNLDHTLKLVVTRNAQNTLVSRISKLVVESRQKKASVEKLVDRFARVYIPIVIGLAIVTAFIFPRVIGGSSETWLYRSLILLVVSCPSAFVISVPATIFTSVAIAARKGIIIKGGIYVERLARIKAVVFDKTGTLTLGEPTIHEVRSIDQIGSRALLYAAALEQYSRHPFAATIMEKARQRHLDFSKLRVTDVEEVPGKGLVGYVNNIHVAVGSMELMTQYACNCDEIDAIRAGDEHSFMCISLEKSAIATVCVIDEVRRDAIATVSNLKETGLHTAMLTGDKKEVAEQTAQILGITDTRSELLPAEKLQALSRIKTDYGDVAMVGDGVNDAPSLAASDVGIAMGSRGVDIALESADVVLVKDKLGDIPYLLALSKQTVKVAKQNITASLAIKILLGSLGLLGFIPLWFTVASGDDGLTMLVLLNTLRLGKIEH